VKDLSDSPEGERLALLWKNREGVSVLETGTDGFTVLGSGKYPPWLPEGWRMYFYPTGLDLPNLGPWFRTIIAWSEAPEPFTCGPDLGVPNCPTVRGMVAHAYMIVRHHALPGSPREPDCPLDRAGYVTHLKVVWDFLRKGVGDKRKNPTASGENPWEGDDWDKLERLPKRLLTYMYKWKEADLRDVCRAVWGEDYSDVTDSARSTAISKANTFLSKRGHRSTLHKERGEAILRWQ
jgi:hypothetical protein